MSRASVLARGQAAAELGMVDACTIRRRTDDNGAAATDPATGQVTEAWTTVYTGKCRLQQSLAQSAQHEPGEDHQLLVRFELQVPMTVTGVRVGDEITITASRDADLVGRTLLVKDLMHKTDATARRLGVTERTD
jgi:hypothetical protein